MKFSLASIILYSSHPQELARFLAHLLDLEIDPHQGEEGLFLRGAKVTFHILSIGEIREGQNMAMAFALESREELEDLLHKVQFMEYRGHTSGVAKRELSGDDSHSFFWVKDPDGRPWKFSHELPNFKH